MRATAMLLFCSTLAACSSAEDLAVPVYVPPSMPTTEAAGKGIKQAAAEAKLKGQPHLAVTAAGKGSASPSRGPILWPAGMSPINK
jgi:hypothetical protein